VTGAAEDEDVTLLGAVRTAAGPGVGEEAANRQPAPAAVKRTHHIRLRGSRQFVVFKAAQATAGAVQNDPL